MIKDELFNCLYREIAVKEEVEGKIRNIFSKYGLGKLNFTTTMNNQTLNIIPLDEISRYALLGIYSE